MVLTFLNGLADMVRDPVRGQHSSEAAGLAAILRMDDLERSVLYIKFNSIGDLDDAIAWASEISGYAPLVVRYFKDQLANPSDSRRYRETMQAILGSEDFAEALRARKESRPPNYTGR